MVGAANFAGNPGIRPSKKWYENGSPDGKMAPSGADPAAPGGRGGPRRRGTSARSAGSSAWETSGPSPGRRVPTPGGQRRRARAGQPPPGGFRRPGGARRPPGAEAGGPGAAPGHPGGGPEEEPPAG